MGAYRYHYVSFELRLVITTAAIATYRNHYDLYNYVSVQLRLVITM